MNIFVILQGRGWLSNLPRVHPATEWTQPKWKTQQNKTNIYNNEYTIYNKKTIYNNKTKRIIYVP